MEIELHQFPKNGGRILEVNEASLLWASLTVGAPSFKAAIQRHNDLPAFTMHKWSAIRSVIEEKDKQAYLNSGFNSLDPSEKGVISFWTGMIFAKLAADNFLNVPWVTHAGIAIKESPPGTFQLEPPDTKSLPDFIGTDDNGVWHIIEAKGYQRRPSGKRIEHFKDQTRRIVSISGEAPATRNVCITKISSRDPITIEMIESETGHAEEVHLNIEPSDFQQYYYQPILSFLMGKDRESEPSYSRDGYHVFREISDTLSTEYEISIGMLREVFEKVKNKSLITSSDLTRSYPNKSENIDIGLRSDPYSYTGSDGIFVDLKKK